jgi:thioesterase domain-containing protein
MNLKALAERASSSQKWFGVQAYGLNEGEQPYSSLSQMAVEDLKLIKSIQPEGPYRLLGYSFGARVALEVALQMEQNGDLIQELVLLAPGSPRVGSVQMLVNDEYSKEASLVCPEFLGILLSVFIGRIDSSLVSECLKRVIHEDSFIDYICELRSDLDRALVARVVRLVVQTYNLNINLESSHDVSLLRQLRAPVKIIKAQGDLPFILEDPNHQKYFNVSEISLDVDHYQVLKEPFLDEWVHQLKLSQ